MPPQPPQIEPGTIIFINTNRARIFNFFGSGYLSYLRDIVTLPVRVFIQNAVMLVRVAIAQARAIGISNQYTDFRNGQFAATLTFVKQALQRDYMSRDVVNDRVSQARDNNILGVASNFFNQAISFTNERVNRLQAQTTLNIAGIRFDMFNTFGFTLVARPIIDALNINLSPSDIPIIGDFLEDTLPEIKRFLDDPISFILGWLIDNLLDLILDLLATTLAGDKTPLETPVFSE